MLLTLIFINTVAIVGFAETNYTFSEDDPTPSVCVSLIDTTIENPTSVVAVGLSAIPGTANGIALLYT